MKPRPLSSTATQVTFVHLSVGKHSIDSHEKVNDDFKTGTVCCFVLVCFFQRRLPTHAELRSCPGCPAVLWSSRSSFKAAGPQAAAGLPVGYSGILFPLTHINPANPLSYNLHLCKMDESLITDQSITFIFYFII